MRFTGAASTLPKHPVLDQEDQEHVIFEHAATIGVPATFLAAIRIAEAGGPGREFGVISTNAPDYESQCRVAALSVRNNTYRFVQRTQQWPTDPAGQLSEPFIAFMANRWAPQGAANDPDNLNPNWPKNVSDAYYGSGIA